MEEREERERRDRESPEGAGREREIELEEWKSMV